LMRGDALPQAIPGTPPRLDQTAQIWGDDESLEMPSTSHISIVDQWGNALSMTTTIENAFGSRLMTKGGFLLNNEMTDFSFRTEKDGAPIANRVEPGKRPRSSMAPTIVMKGGKPHLVIGSPGGSRIIGYVAQAIIAYVDWGMDAQQAVAMPHLVNRFGVFEIEQGTAEEALANALTAKGFEVKIRGLNSGLHAIAITPDGGNRGGDGGGVSAVEGVLEGGADPRREGLALGR
jgi:gamma-glutamyltranspeptidase/glutathione hydrolase